MPASSQAAWCLPSSEALRSLASLRFTTGVRWRCFLDLIPFRLANLKSINIADATLCSLAGVSTVDRSAAAASLPPVDGMDLSAALGIRTGRPAQARRRSELVIGTADTSQRWVQGLYLEGSAGASGAEAPLYKLLLGVVNQDAHSAPLSPNRTMSASLSFPSGNDADWVPDAFALDCGDGGCLTTCATIRASATT